MQKSELNDADGLFHTPFTSHDLAVIALAIAGYLYIMYLSYKNENIKNPQLHDWGGVFILVMLSAVGIYEYSIYRKLPFGLFLPAFGISIILSKEISDWLFMSKEGKKLVINTFKEIISVILGRMGYTKKENDTDGTT